jgi:hypothetical protein
MAVSIADPLGTNPLDPLGINQFPAPPQRQPDLSGSPIAQLIQGLPEGQAADALRALLVPPKQNPTGGNFAGEIFHALGGLDPNSSPSTPWGWPPRKW